MASDAEPEQKTMADMIYRSVQTLLTGGMLLTLIYGVSRISAKEADYDAHKAATVTAMSEMRRDIANLVSAINSLAVATATGAATDSQHSKELDAIRNELVRLKGRTSAKES